MPGWRSFFSFGLGRKKELRPELAALAVQGVVARRATLGRADLAEALARGETELDAMARLLGYEDAAPAVRAPPLDVPPPASAEAVPSAAMAARAAQRPDQPALFLRTDSVEFFDPDPAPPPTPRRLPVRSKPLPGEPGRARPLAPWPRLWRRLHPALCRTITGSAVDTRKLVERLSRGELVRELPRRTHRALASRVHVVVERAGRLVPYWDDQEDVYKALSRRLGARAKLVWRLESVPSVAALGAEWQPGEAALVLGDLGLFAGARGRAEWQSESKRLAERGVVLAALVPASPARWPQAGFGAWRALDWESGATRARPGAPSTSSSVERLLALLAPAVRVELGLLRDARRLLGAGGADAALELEALSHPDTLQASTDGLFVRAERHDHHRKAFGALPLAVRRQALKAIRSFRPGLPEVIWHEEALAAYAYRSEDEPEHALVDRDTLARARRCFTELAEHLGSARSGDVLPEGLVAYFKRFNDRGQPTWEGELAPHLRRAWAVLYGDDPNAVPPPGIEPAELVREPEAPAEHYRLWQIGGELVALSAVARPGPSETPAGSPLCEFDTAEARFFLEADGAPLPQRLLEPADPPARASKPLALPPAARLSLKTERARVTLLAEPMPSWASAMGRDRWGLFADLEHAGPDGSKIVQRMRWIAPGRFWMGSPENEPSRGESERRHLVTLTQGYWLADTACTQALWQAVMGNNPSRFQGAQLPVEQVSHDDCQKFLQRLNAAHRDQDREAGVELRLPAEAEWEYACRAGTETPFWFGENITTEQVNYDGRYPYAGGAKGEYREKTIAVKELRPNGWGLYQMHGNVWEWCNDWSGPYERAYEVDPWGPEQGTVRVLRGGSWLDGARFARSAQRLGSPPEDRYVDFGFRLARGRKKGGG